MSKHKLRTRLIGAATLGVAVIAGTLTTGVLPAAAYTVPPWPTSQFGTYPQFLSGNVEGIRSSGSDTTFYMMQNISDLYTGAGLYGCTLGTTETACTGNGSPGGNTNVATTDTSDNFDRVEVTTGVDDVGSGAGQKQLCGTVNSPLTVNFARSSKPIASISGCNMVETGYAKDGVVPVDFPTANPGLIGATDTSVSYGASGTSQLPWAAAVSSSANEAANGGAALMGPVAKGWLPGDPINGPYSGVALSTTGNDPAGGIYGISNILPSATAATEATAVLGQNASVAYRLWCATDSTRITDWGQLTNLKSTGPGNGGVAKTMGNGTPIGIPVRIVGINSSSGTVATWASYANSGYATGNCNSTNETEINAANYVGTNPPANPPQALENNVSQVGDFARDDLPNDPADQAAEIATSLYFMSNGVYAVNTPAITASITSAPANVSGSYVAQELDANNVAPGLTPDLQNKYPTARTLYNIYTTGGGTQATVVTASTADFLNWICDANNGVTPALSTNPIVKQNDNETHVNFDTELGNIIGTQYGFTRLTDQTNELANNKLTPADGLTAPNGQCAAQAAGFTTTATQPTATLTTTAGVTTVTLTGGATFPSAVTVGTPISDPQYTATYNSNPSSLIPAGDTVASIANDRTSLTLTNVDSADGSGDTLLFPNLPPVTEVGSAGLSQ